MNKKNKLDKLKVFLIFKFIKFIGEKVRDKNKKSLINRHCRNMVVWIFKYYSNLPSFNITKFVKLHRHTKNEKHISIFLKDIKIFLSRAKHSEKIILIAHCCKKDDQEILSIVRTKMMTKLRKAFEENDLHVWLYLGNKFNPYLGAGGWFDSDFVKFTWSDSLKYREQIDKGTEIIVSKINNYDTLLETQVKSENFINPEFTFGSFRKNLAIIDRMMELNRETNSKEILHRRYNSAKGLGVLRIQLGHLLAQPTTA